MTPPVPSAASALRVWATVLARTVLRLGPAVALARVRPERARALSRRWSAEVLRAFGIEISVDDRAQLGPRPSRVLLVHLNQQTLLAPAIYLAEVPQCALVVNVEFALLPLVGWLSVATGGACIVRQWPAQAKAVMRRVADRLRQGEAFGISIEGQRSRDGSLSPFKKGAAVLAIEAGADVVPFMTHGEWALWPRGEWRVRPGKIDVVFYPPISTRGLRYEDRDALTEQLRKLAEAELAARA